MGSLFQSTEVYFAKIGYVFEKLRFSRKVGQIHWFTHLFGRKLPENSRSRCLRQKISSGACFTFNPEIFHLAAVAFRSHRVAVNKVHLNAVEKPGSGYASIH